MRHCITILTFAFLLQGIKTEAQGPTNANRYNYTVFSTGYYYGPDNRNGTNYPAFRMKAAVDVNNTATRLMDASGNGASHSTSWDADTPSRKSSGWRQILRANNQTRTYYDYTVVAFDNFCGGRVEWNSYCFPATSDGIRYSMWNRLSALNGESGSYYSRWEKSGEIEMRLHSTWRYANGERRSEPLTFGTIPTSGFRSHVNNNRRAPSNIARDGFLGAGDVGYINSWTSNAHPDLDNAPDVTYTFTITELTQVDISTNNATTNYNSRLHLAKDISATAWEMIESNDGASPGNTKARIVRVLEPGNYFIVVEGDSGATGRFNLTISTSPATMTSGTIGHPMPWVPENCELTIAVQGQEATSSFAPIIYDWEVSSFEVQGGDTVVTFDRIIANKGPSLEGNELESIDEPIMISRIAKSAGIIRKTGSVALVPITFNQEGYNGVISGHVSGRDGTGDVAGVVVYAEPYLNVHGACEIYSDTTDANGDYEISNIYYGYNGDFQNITNASYKVYPVFEDHIFEQDTLIVDNIQTSARVKTDKDFKDITTFFIRGRITQEDHNSTTNTVCGAPGVRLYLNDGNNDISLGWMTDHDGNYSIAVPNQGVYTLRPEFLNHEFNPPVTLPLNVIDDFENIDFKDTSRTTISGSIKAACEEVFGQVHLLIKDTLNCFEFAIDTEPDGNFILEVPAGVYNISVTDQFVDDLIPPYRLEDISAYFNRVRQVDVSQESVTEEMVYRQKPSINVVGLPVKGCDTVMIQQTEYDLVIEIEENTNGYCLMDTGTLIIIDAVSGREQQVLPVSQGIVRYKVKAGDPNFAGDNKKLLSLTARHLRDSTLSITRDIRIIVEGTKAREQTFTTVSPQVPFVILRDPPGDGSYAYLEESSSSELALGFSTLLGGGANIWQKTKLGSAFSVSGLVISTESSTWGEVGTSTTVSASNTNSVETKLTFTNGVRYETSSDDNPDVMGAGGDLFIGAAMSLKYAKADVLTYDEVTCNAIETVELIMGDPSMETKFVYTEFNIRNSIIPSLESLRDLETEPAQIAYYQNQVDVWNQTLTRNEELKEQAVPNTAFPINPLDEANSSISWSGQTSQGYTATSTSSRSLALEFDLEIEREISAELGFEVAGSGSSGGALIRTRLELGSSISSLSLQSRITGFVLTDDDPLDRYLTDILKCPVYSTPVFRNEAAITSCPYEPNTSPIDGPVLEALNPIVTNVAPDGDAGFNFRITNRSQDEKTRSYYLDIVDASNPHGAKINTPLPILYEDMAYDEDRSRFISISREGADPNIFSYEGLEFVVYPAECDDKQDFTSNSVRVSAYFNSTCSGVSMMEPQQGWITNVYSNDLRRVHIKDYNKTQLTDITVQYTKAGFDSWRTATGPLVPADLNDNGTNGTFVDWNVENIVDGAYDLRLKLTCGGGTIYTERIRGVIDRRPAFVLGIPHPIDDDYDLLENDDISVKLTEDISCAQATVTIRDLETDAVLNATLTCNSNGNTVQVVPQEAIDLREPSVYRVSIKGLVDMANNSSADINWVFIVGDYVYDPDCSPVMISNNNANQDAISQSVYRATEITSDGTVATATTIGYKAAESVTLEAGFSVNSGGGLEASIENCEND